MRLGFFCSVRNGELREIDASGGGESAAKCLNRAAAPVFPPASYWILPDGCPHEPDLWKEKTGDPNFRTAEETFPAHSARVFTQARTLLGISFCVIIIYFQLL
jgi:hypothetical protein